MSLPPGVERAPVPAAGVSGPSRAAQVRAALVVLVGLAALVALALQLLGGWEKSVETVAAADRGWLAASLLLTLAYLSCSGLGWWLTLRSLGFPLPMLEGIRIFFLSSLTRYLPGRIWYTVTRVYMCGQVGVPAAVASVSLIVEILLVLASGALVAALAVPLILADYGPPAILLGALVLAGGLVALHPVILGPAIVIFARLLRRPLATPPQLAYRSVIGLVGFYVVAWALGAAALWTLLAGLHPLAVDTIPTVAAAYAVSFLIGFVNPLMPAGLGVREGALALLLGWVAPLPIAAAVAVLFRVTVTLAEGVWVLIAAVLQYFWLRRGGGRGGERAAIPTRFDRQVARQSAEQVAPCTLTRPTGG